METVETITQGPFEARIIHDYYPEDCNPRQDDNLGTMVCLHRRYNLGDDHGLGTTCQEIADAMAEQFDQKIIRFPLYLYDHSGLAISTRSWIGRAQHAEWDSGQVGFIFVSLEKVRQEYGIKNVTKAIRKEVEDLLRSEVEEYDRYLRGEVYGFHIFDTRTDEQVESCGGFLGLESVKQETSDRLTHLVAEYSTEVEGQEVA